MPKFPRFQRRHAIREVRKKYIVATEGEKTEKIYFEGFRNQNYRKNIFVQILPTRDGNSSPADVLKRLKNFSRDKVFDATRDECWLVIDFDHWTQDSLDNISNECKAAKFNLAVSTPCFELWLNLHQANPKAPKTCKECSRELKKLLGSYEKNNYDVSKLLNNVAQAIQAAKTLDTDPTSPFPKTTGSRVYLLVNNLLKDE